MTDLVDKLIGSVIAALVAAAVGLFVRLRVLEGKRGIADQRLDNLEEDVRSLQEIKGKLDELNTTIAMERVRREEWVPTMSKIMAALERQSETLARLDERMKNMEERRSADR